MKKNDITSIILIVVISFIFAYFVGNAVFNKPESRSTPVETVNPYQTEITSPSTEIFNEFAINPTEDITINSSTTDKPFTQE